MRLHLQAPNNPYGLLPHLCSGVAVFGLVVAGELIALALALSKNTLMTFSWSELGYLSMVVQWIVLLSAIVLCQLAPVFTRFSNMQAGCLAYFCVLCIAFLVIIPSLWILDDYVDMAALLKNMVLAAIFSGIILRYLYLQQQLRNQQQAELQSRLQALHARIRPHFLFNAMNAVASLIVIDPDKAEKVVEDLSEIFRVSLKEMNLVTLDEEIDLCRRYTDIEQTRLGERLQIEWSCQHDCGSVLVPSLLLQPLLENAIYHGIQRLTDGGTVQVSTQCTQQGAYPQLALKVSNPMPELVDNQTDTLDNITHNPKGNRMALNNIEHRLQAHYGKHTAIQVERTQGKTAMYEVTITVPINHNSRHNSQ